jgi:hypothetical protein
MDTRASGIGSETWLSAGRWCNAQMAPGRMLVACTESARATARNGDEVNGRRRCARASASMKMTCTGRTTCRRRHKLTADLNRSLTSGWGVGHGPARTLADHSSPSRFKVWSRCPAEVAHRTGTAGAGVSLTSSRTCSRSGTGRAVVLPTSQHPRRTLCALKLRAIGVERALRGPRTSPRSWSSTWRRARPGPRRVRQVRCALSPGFIGRTLETYERAGISCPFVSSRDRSLRLQPSIVRKG